MRRRRHLPVVESPLEEHPDAVAPDVWAAVVERHDRELLLEAMQRLPAPQRLAVELAFLHGRTHREISTITGVPLGTVKGRVRLGLRALSRSLRHPLSVVPDQSPALDAPALFASPSYATSAA